MAELGAEIAADYEGREPLLVAPLKSSTVFLADLSRALPILHTIDVIEMAAYSDGRRGGVRLLKDLDVPIAGRDVIIVEDVVDTGLTLAFLNRTLAERDPASVVAVTLLDRPYRRLVEKIGLRYVGFTVPDELFARLATNATLQCAATIKCIRNRHHRPGQPRAVFILERT